MERIHHVSKLSKKNYYILLLVVFGGFLVFGLSENIRGPALPNIQLDFSLSEAQLGFLLAINSLGYLLACSFTSAVSNKIGIKWTGIIAFSSLGIAGLMMYMSTNYAYLTASYFLLYISNGMLEIGLGIMAARIFIKNTGTMLNISHFFYGLGSTIAPISAASMMGWNMFDGELGWRGMYFLMLSFSLLPIIPSLLGKFPKTRHDDQHERVSIQGLIRDPIAWLIVATLTFGVVSELAVGSWLVYYLEKMYDWTIADASKMLSIFFVFFMLSRLLLGPITDKIGYTFSVIVFSALSGLCSLAAIVIGESGAIMFAVAGVGIAPIYPTIMALVAKRYPRGTDAAITFVVTLMGIGSVIGNVLIGFVIEYGLQAGYAFIAILALVCSICSIILYIILRRRNELF
jgi:fucose permease